MPSGADGTAQLAVQGFDGIGGVISTPNEVRIGDKLEMVYGNAWGRYNVIERITTDVLLYLTCSMTSTPFISGIRQSRHTYSVSYHRLQHKADGEITMGKACQLRS